MGGMSRASSKGDKLMFTVHAKDEKETQISPAFHSKQAAVGFAAKGGISVLLKRNGELDMVYYPWHANNG